MAPAEIVAALALVNRVAGVDVIILGRGGGSSEDLWAFNDERVAEAAVVRIASAPIFAPRLVSCEYACTEKRPFW